MEYVTVEVSKLESELLSGANRTYAMCETPISFAIAFNVPTRSCSLYPSIVSVSLIAAESIVILAMELRHNIILRTKFRELSQGFVAGITDHRASRRINSSCHFRAQINEFNANVDESACFRCGQRPIFDSWRCRSLLRLQNFGFCEHPSPPPKPQLAPVTNLPY
jgi:hypothetical protein